MPVPQRDRGREKRSRFWSMIRRAILSSCSNPPEPGEIKLSNFHMASSAVQPSPSQLREQFREACPARLNPN
jgi:hypothetical protein